MQNFERLIQKVINHSKYQNINFDTNLLSSKLTYQFIHQFKRQIKRKYINNINVFIYFQNQLNTFKLRS